MKPSTPLASTSDVQPDTTPAAFPDMKSRQIMDCVIRAQVAKEKNKKEATQKKILDLERKLEKEKLARVDAENEVKALALQNACFHRKLQMQKAEEERQKLKIQLQQLAQQLLEEQDDEQQSTILDRIVEIAAALQGQGSGSKKLNPL